MGNILRGKKTTAKVMKIDGTTLRLKSPAQAGDVLRDHPRYDILESGDVKLLGLRARPLDPDQPLKPGKLYFLVELPRLPTARAPRREWSGTIHVTARDRLESLKLSRRSVSDLTVVKPHSLTAEKISRRSVSGRSLAKPLSLTAAEQTQEGAVRLRMRLPKAQVAKLMEESKDAAEAAEKIMELCAFRGNEAAQRPPGTAHMRRKEKQTRFAAMADEVIA